MFYEFNQNNSYGRFDVDDKVCHRLFIEAENEQDAIYKAEELGCYWHGVEQGIDCPCCGDRWRKFLVKPLNIEKYATGGYRVSLFDLTTESAESQWNRLYGGYEVLEEPKWANRFGRVYEGVVSLRNIEEYAQFMADTYGWTVPDARIYYADGKVVEVHSKRKVFG